MLKEYKAMSRYPEILEVINAVRAQVRWKPNSAEYHLKKRKMRGHLPQTASLEDYEGIILKILQDKSAVVYRYWYNSVPYVTLTAEIQSKQWLVMFSYDGIMESCFVVERPERYLSNPGFEGIGKLVEVDNEL
jgi:hypothetical protein